MRTCQRCDGRRLVYILACCTDRCMIEVAGRRHTGYKPRDLGIGGEDVHMTYCMDCGQIQGDFPVPPTEFEAGRVGHPIPSGDYSSIERRRL